MEYRLPPRFLERMCSLLDTDFERFIQSYDRPLRRGVRVNTGKITVSDFLKVFGCELTPSPFAPESFYLDSPHLAGADPLHHAGAYYMQEPSAASAVSVLDPKPGERILDLCAAPGGKSTQIAARMQGQGLLWCNEYIRPRAQILLQNIERCGVKNAVVSSGAPAVLAERLVDCFDAILVDAPCSGEGMFRKEEAAITDWSEEAVKACADRQLDILSSATKMLRPGGRLVYSTCTFAPEENECTVAAFLAAHPDFEPMPVEVPFGRPGFSWDKVAAFAGDTPVDSARFSPEACRRILPFDGGEGHFVAAFRKGGDSPATYLPYSSVAGETVRTSAAQLYEDLFTGEMTGTPAETGEFIRLLPAGLPALKGLPVLSAGVQLAEKRKNRLEPCHAAFLAASADNCRRRVDLAPDDPRLLSFLRGEEIEVFGDNGFTAVSVAGVVVGFGKVSGGRLKNRYPKGLRLRS